MLQHLTMLYINSDCAAEKKKLFLCPKVFQLLPPFHQPSALLAPNTISKLRERINSAVHHVCRGGLDCVWYTCHSFVLLFFYLGKSTHIWAPSSCCCFYDIDVEAGRAFWSVLWFCIDVFIIYMNTIKKCFSF